MRSTTQSMAQVSLLMLYLTFSSTVREYKVVDIIVMTRAELFMVTSDFKTVRRFTFCLDPVKDIQVFLRKVIIALTLQ